MSIEAERAVLCLWCARLTWVVLPVSAGNALSDALSDWSTGPARVASVLLWGAWALGLVALFAPRPWGLTVLRVVAPSAVVLTIASVASSSAGSGALAISSSVVAAALALSAPVAQAAGNAGAYGDEQRFPLRTPTSLFLGPVPLAVVLIGAGVSAGPLLVADGTVVVGLLLTAIGFAIAALLIRSLHALGRRWLVLVPAGVVVVDPLALADPVLMRREQIAELRRARNLRRAPEALDLRLGTPAGSVLLTLRAPQPFARRRGRRDSELVDAGMVLVSTVRTNALVAQAGRRHIPIG